MTTQPDSHLFSSESVTEGHPDKVADQISDTVLDLFLAEDPESLVACETLVTTDYVLLAGEISSQAKGLAIEESVRRTVKEIGYTDSEIGFDADSFEFNNRLHEQSKDIRQGVQKSSGEIGAGDQGLMFGYACNESPEHMPLCISLSHKICQKLAAVRKEAKVDWLRPDGKSQVTIRYEKSKPVEVDTVVLSTQHSDGVEQEEIRNFVLEEVIKNTLPAELLSESIKYHINPTGRFVVGGPFGDAGITGRKVIVDTYGGYAPHGGGAFSGKDPTKVDRSAAYFARFVAKNVVAAGLAERFQIQLAYAIGVADPVSVHVDAFGSEKVDLGKIYSAIREIFPFKPAEIIQELDLRRPIYKKTATYGHFGRSDESFPWESTSKVSALKSYFNL